MSAVYYTSRLYLNRKDQSSSCGVPCLYQVWNSFGIGVLENEVRGVDTGIPQASERCRSIGLTLSGRKQVIRHRSLILSGNITKLKGF